MDELSKFLDTVKYEAQVQRHYLVPLEKKFKTLFTHIFRTDGLLDSKDLHILAEFKLHKEKDLTNILDLVDCIIQILFYLKKISKSKKGEKIPSLILIGSEKFFCLFETNKIINYLNESIDWSLDPSGACTKVLTLKNKLLCDSFVKSIFPFSLYESRLIEVLNSYSKLSVLEVPYTKLSIHRAFDDFLTSQFVAEDLTPNEIVTVFCGLLFGDFCIHTSKRNVLCTNLKEKPFIKVDQRKYEKVLNLLKSIKVLDKNIVISETDNLIEEISRREKGEFYTPTEIANLAHKYTSFVFGEDWKDNYETWDPAWGTGNLTRDYVFKNLSCSTILQSDLDLVENKFFNPGSNKFQYDFLRDDVFDPDLVPFDEEDKLLEKAPELVVSFKENKKIIIIMNPPYTGPGNSKRNGVSKTGVGETKVNSHMLKEHLDYPSCQLHYQFLYRIIMLKKKYNLTNLHICTFFPPLLFTGPKSKKFRKLFFDHFSFIKGFIFKADKFSDVTGSWGITFSIFSSEKSIERNIFKFDVIDTDSENLEVIGTKVLYNTDNCISATEWVKEKLTDEKIETVTLTTAIEVKKWFNGKFLVNSEYIGWLGNSGNNPSDVPTYTSIYTAGQSLGISITRENFYECVALFSAKSLTEINWINCKDEYLKPTDEVLNSEEYKQWNRDCIVFSLFSNSSSQSSLRKLLYKDKLWDIENNFFWLPVNYIESLALKYQDKEVESDVKSHCRNRFIFEELQKNTLSLDAKEVLDEATILLEKSFEQRQNFSSIYTHWNISSWDAGWYQIKLLLNECGMLEELDSFKEKFKKFSERLHEGVYKFGFLR